MALAVVGALASPPPAKRVSIVLFLTSPLPGKVTGAMLFLSYLPFNDVSSFQEKLIVGSSTSSTVVLYTHNEYAPSGNYVLFLSSAVPLAPINFTLSKAIDTGEYYLVELQV